MGRRLRFLKSTVSPTFFRSRGRLLSKTHRLSSFRTFNFAKQTMQIIKSRPFGPVDPAALSELEAQVGGQLPEPFRTFLIEHNGPLISPCEFHVEDYIDGIDDELYGLHQNKEKDLREAYFYSSQDLPRDLLPFASDGGGNIICIGLSEARRGKIYFVDHELYDEDDQEAGVILLADSLEAFFDGLFEYEE